MKRIVKFLLFISVILCTVLINSYSTLTNVYALTSIIEPDTNSDENIFEGARIQELCKNIKNDQLDFYGNTKGLESIIPREFLYSNEYCEYKNIGSEWGVYAIINGSAYDSRVDVIVFDITLKEYNVANQFKFRVEPLLQTCFMIGKRDSKIYIEKHKSNEKIYMSNPRIGFNIENQNQDNYGDVGYDKAKDTGAVLSQSRLNYKCYYEKTNNYFFDTGVFLINEFRSIACGLLPVGGDIMNIYLDTTNFLISIGNPVSSYYTECNNEAFICTFSGRDWQLENSNNDYFIRSSFTYVDTSIYLNEESYVENIIILDSNSPSRLTTFCDFDFTFGYVGYDMDLLDGSCGFESFLENKVAYDSIGSSRIIVQKDLFGENTNISAYDFEYYILDNDNQVFIMNMCDSGYYSFNISNDKDCDIDALIYSEDEKNKVVYLHCNDSYYLEANTSYYLKLICNERAKGSISIRPSVLEDGFVFSLNQGDSFIYQLNQPITTDFYYTVSYNGTNITVYNSNFENITICQNDFSKDFACFTAFSEGTFYIKLNKYSNLKSDYSINIAKIEIKETQDEGYLLAKETTMRKFSPFIDGDYTLVIPDSTNDNIDVMIYDEDGIIDIIKSEIGKNRKFSFYAKSDNAYYIYFQNNSSTKYNYEIIYKNCDIVYKKVGESKYQDLNNSTLYRGESYFIKVLYSGNNYTFDEHVEKQWGGTFIHENSTDEFSDDCYLIYLPASFNISKTPCSISVVFYEIECRCDRNFYFNIEMNADRNSFDVSFDSSIGFNINYDGDILINYNEIIEIEYAYTISDDNQNSCWGLKTINNKIIGTTITRDLDDHISYVKVEIKSIKVKLDNDYITSLDLSNCVYEKTWRFSSGQGTIENPFVIKDCLEFLKIKETKKGNIIGYSFELDNFNFYGANYIDPIDAKFTGVLDGCDYEFWACLKAGNFSNGDYALFKSISGIIKNFKLHLTVYGTPQESYSKFGFLCVYNYGRIENCLISGVIGSSDFRADAKAYGGIVAENSGTIINCNSNSWFYCGTYAGGIASINNNYATIQNCTFGGSIHYIKITTNEDCIGGIVGYAQSGSVNNCIYSGYIEVMDYTEDKGHNHEYHFLMAPYIGGIYGRCSNCNVGNNTSSGSINIDKLQSNINWWNWGFHHHDQTANVH